jgi:hypothetical protein
MKVNKILYYNLVASSLASVISARLKVEVDPGFSRLTPDHEILCCDEVD